MPDMTSLVAVVAPRTSKITKNDLGVFARGENLLHNGVLHFVFKPIFRIRVTKLESTKNRLF